MLRLTDLSKRYAGFQLGPLDLTVDDEVLVVLGPSGCGKSTLLSIIAGITPPDAGAITLDGRSLDGSPPESRRVGMVFQDGALFPHMTARENIEYAATDTERVDRLVDALEIADVLDQPAPTLSGGERQRVALTRVLAAEPDVLLLDEPLSSLDTPIRHRLRDELHELFAALSIPVVYVTHDQEAATALGDRTAVLRDGTIEQVGTTTEIRNTPATPFVASFTGTRNVFRAELRRDPPNDPVLVLAGQEIPLDGPVPDQDPVTVSIRSSDLRLTSESSTSEAAAGRITFDGTIRRCIDARETVRVVCDVPGLGEPLRATVLPSTHDTDVMQAGSTVHLSIAPPDIHCIPEANADPAPRY